MKKFIFLTLFVPFIASAAEGTLTVKQVPYASGINAKMRMEQAFFDLSMALKSASCANEIDVNMEKSSHFLGARYGAVFFIKYKCPAGVVIIPKKDSKGYTTSISLEANGRILSKVNIDRFD
jgi:hypothetical protein